MEDFVFGDWEIDCDTDKFTSVIRWITKKNEDGSVRKIMISLSIGKGDNPSVIGVHDPEKTVAGVIYCDDVADALNKVEVLYKIKKNFYELD